MSKSSLVLKIGGSILEEGISPNILEDIKNFNSENKIILVHGGGKEVTEIAEKLGKPQKFIVSPTGIRSRYTDLETAIIFTMVMVGKINKEIVLKLQKNGIKAIGISGVDGSMIKANRKKKLIIINDKGRKMFIDGGYTGKITEVESSLLNLLLEKGYVPVISPVAIGDEGELLNVDGDRAAAYIAGSIKADRLVFFTDVMGVLMNGEIISRMNLVMAKEIMPKIGFGMEKKILASTEAIEMGVRECIIAPGKIDNPIQSAIGHIKGTVICSE